MNFNFNKIQYKMKQFIFLSILFVFYNCETEVDVSNLLNQEQLLIINGYLSPQDTVLKVQVSKSLSIANKDINTDNLIVKDASVSITSEDGSTVSLDYSLQNKNYEKDVTSDFSIVAGKKYFLEVQVDNQKYNATCEIPLNTIENINFELDDDIKYDRQDINISFDDIKNEPNNYIVRSLKTGAARDEDWNVMGVDFIRDINRENQPITLSYKKKIPTNADKEIFISINILNAEKIMYDQLSALSKNSTNEDDIFYTDIIAPSNIQGNNVYGVFAGYQRAIINKKVK